MMVFLQLPGVPPSNNNAYFDRVIVLPAKGTSKRAYTVKRELTAEGRKYQRETGAYLISHYPAELRIMQPDMPLGIAVLVDFPQMLNKGWPKTAKSRYKKLDAENRTKLLIDIVSESGGIDDSQFMISLATKRQGPELTSIWIWNVDEEGLIPYALTGGNAPYTTATTGPE
jgi:hypothetical protein